MYAGYVPSIWTTSSIARPNSRCLKSGYLTNSYSQAYDKKCSLVRPTEPQGIEKHNNNCEEL